MAMKTQLTMTIFFSGVGISRIFVSDTAIPKIVYRYRVSQKNVVSWKNSHNYPQTHPKCKCWGCIGKFRIFATK